MKLLQCYILQIYLVGVCAIDARSWVGGTTDRYRAQKTQKVLKKSKDINHGITELIHAKFLVSLVYNKNASYKRIFPQRYENTLHFTINICVDKQRLWTSAELMEHCVTGTDIKLQLPVF